MNTTINTLIDKLIAIREKEGNIFVMVQSQVMLCVEPSMRIEDLCINEKPVGLKCLIIEGYKK